MNELFKLTPSGTLISYTVDNGLAFMKGLSIGAGQTDEIEFTFLYKGETNAEVDNNKIFYSSLKLLID